MSKITRKTLCSWTDHCVYSIPGKEANKNPMQQRQLLDVHEGSRAEIGAVPAVIRRRAIGTGESAGAQQDA
jgi:hypothetical protein